MIDNPLAIIKEAINVYAHQYTFTLPDGTTLYRDAGNTIGIGGVKLNEDRNKLVTIHELTMGEISQNTPLKLQSVKTGDLLIRYGRCRYEQSNQFETRIVIQKNPQTERMIENILDFRDCQH